LAAKKIGKRAFASHLAVIEPRDTLYEDAVSGSKKRVRVRLLRHLLTSLRGFPSRAASLTSSPFYIHLQRELPRTRKPLAEWEAVSVR
jgi:hypothetical protein